MTISVPIYDEAEGRDFASFPISDQPVLFAGSRNQRVEKLVCSLLLQAFAGLEYKFVVGCASGVDQCFREALLKNKLSIGTWIQIGHPALAEILARVGYDWICVDLEHGSIDIESLTDLFRAVEVNDCVPIARLPFNDPIWIRRSLDAGAMGLIIPMVNSAQEIKAAIRHAKYPPRGERGYGYSRANSYGMDFKEYIAEANETIAIIAQIEHKDGIET